MYIHIYNDVEFVNKNSTDVCEIGPMLAWFFYWWWPVPIEFLWKNNPCDNDDDSDYIGVYHSHFTGKVAFLHCLVIVAYRNLQHVKDKVTRGFCLSGMLNS